MISPNYTILKPTVFVLTYIYAKVFEKRGRSQKNHVTSHQGQVSNLEGAPMVPLCLKSGAIPTIIYKDTDTSEQWPTQEISARFGPFFIELS